MKMEGEENLNAAGIVDEKDADIEHDVKALIEADEQLKELLEIDADANLDDDYFFE